MSKLPSLAGASIDLSKLREIEKETITDFLKSIPGEKCVILDAQLSKMVNLLAEGAAVFKENDVSKFLQLTEERIFVNSKCVLFMIRPSVRNTRIVASLIKTMLEAKEDHAYYVVFVPSKSQMCIQVLRDEGIYGDVDILELDLDLVPYDTDLLLMEMKDSFKDMYVYGDSQYVKHMAKSLVKLQVLYGLIPIVDMIGPNAANTAALMNRLRKEAKIADDPNNPPSISRLIIVDRSADHMSLFVTPLTYEGLIHEIVGIENGSVSVDGAVVGRTPDTKTTVPLNSSDILYTEIRNQNISVVPLYLKDKSHEIQSLYNNRPKEGDADLAKLSSFVKQLPTLKDAFDQIQVHLGMVELITSNTNGYAFRQKWQTELETLEGENMLDFITERITLQESLMSILRLLCLYSAVNKGIRPKDYDQVRREIIQTYGYERMLQLYMLEKAGLLVRRDGGNNYTSVKNKLKLMRSDVDGSKMIDMNYVTSGFAPLIPRLIQTIVQTGTLSSDIVKLCGLEFDHQQIYKDKTPRERQVVLVAFLGGVTFLELAALRYITKTEPVDIIVLSTHVTNGTQVLEMLDETPPLKTTPLSVPN